MSAALLNTKTRALIAWLADTIIPQSAAMPSASDIGLTGKPLDVALSARPDLVALLESMPEPADSHATASYLDDLSPYHRDGLLQAVLGAYYMHPEVKRRLGYHGQLAQTLPRGGFGGEELIEQVMSQPPRYRRPVGG